VRLTLELDKAADAAYIQVSNAPVHTTREIDDQRVLDYDEQGEIVGIEFLDVSHGVSLRDLPYRDALAKYFAEHEIPVLV
jgi:uncharacterized protein YuzE